MLICDTPNKMTSPSRLRVGFLVVLFFVVTSAILSSYTQFGTLVLSIFSHVQFEIFPVFTRPSTTIKTSTNAPWTNRKPPQSPPSFTATPASLVEDAKTICSKLDESCYFFILEVLYLKSFPYFHGSRH